MAKEASNRGLKSCLPVADSNAIVVVGMHRSGTSLITGALAKSGLYLGGPLLGESHSNPGGHWEHKGLIALHDRLLGQLGSTWDDVRPLPDGWATSRVAQLAIPKFLRLLEDSFRAHRTWGFKDPRVCRLLPLWHQVFQALNVDPSYVMVLRDPDEVAASLRQRENFSLAKGHLLWLQSVLTAEYETRNCRRVWVSFERFRQKPEQSLKVLETFLELPGPKKGVPELKIRTPASAKLKLEHPASQLSQAVYLLSCACLDGEDPGALSDLDEKREFFESAATLFTYPEALPYGWSERIHDLMFRFKRLFRKIQWERNRRMKAVYRME